MIVFVLLLLLLFCYRSIQTFPFICSIISSSKYLVTLIESLRPFRRRVLTTKSLASACMGDGSSGRSTTLSSNGSPGMIAQ